MLLLLLLLMLMLMLMLPLSGLLLLPPHVGVGCLNSQEQQQ
jgi:hypothetical protein